MSAADTQHQPSAVSSRSTLGIVPATALVMGSVIGTGVFLLPAAFAPYGPISLVGFGLAAVGAVALALTFGALARRDPGAGGPYSYARSTFGALPGFLAAWFYWITAWVSRAGMVVGWIVYVEVFVNTDRNVIGSMVIGMVGLWLPAAINISGLRNMASVQVLTTVLKLIPLVIISTVGLFFIDWSLLTPFDLSGEAPLAAIVSCMALAVFAYLGVETASVAAGRVRNPRRNVPLASLLGTLACTAVYLMSTLVVFGTVSNADLQAPGAQPFVLSFDAMFGGSWAGYAVAIAAIISGFGAINGWTMVCAEISQVAAREGLFPKHFARESDRGIPVFGIVLSTGLASLLVVIGFVGQAGVGVFTVMVLLAGLSAAVPYGLSALALIDISRRQSTRTPGALWWLDGAVATVAVGFVILIIYGAFTAEGTRMNLLWMSLAALVVGLLIFYRMARKAKSPSGTAPGST
ncbi:MAG: amino acid permease [Candidatus Nanopelagicales bacterium]